MPHIVIKMYPGNTEQEKRELTKKITESVMAVTQKTEAAVSVAIEEIPKSEWMDKVYKTEILPNMETLYKKPGY